MAAPNLLDISTCKEEFSIAYVHAITAAAGYAFEARRVDRYGVDAEIVWRSFRIDVQLKCTDAGDPAKDLAYPLDARTFNLLTEPDRTVPAFLFVVEVPPSQNDWLTIGHNRLAMFQYGFYREMRGLSPLPAGATKKTVHLKRRHRLTAPALHRIMTRGRAGQPVHLAKGPVLP